MYGIRDEDIEVRIFDKRTGKEIKVLSLARVNIQPRWEKVVARQLALVIGTDGNQSTKFIAYTLEAKGDDNKILGSYADMANDSGVSIGTVKKIMPKLKKCGYIKQLFRDVYMVNPKTVRPGEKWKGAALIDIWEDV